MYEILSSREQLQLPLPGFLFLRTVLLHNYYDWTPSSPDAVKQVLAALAWMHVICICGVVAFYELPARLSLRCDSPINLCRLDRVVDVDVDYSFTKVTGLHHHKSE